MADKTHSAGNGAVPTADSPAAIRNVVLVGPSGAGKTTLVEALLVAAGVLTRPGSVVDGSTVCDFDDAEISQQRSVGLALAPLQHNGIKVNLIDTPGYADFVGELRAGLRAADCALFVIAANEDIDEPTKALWQECAAVGMPRAVVITKLDHARANYANALAGAQQAFGDKVAPLYFPAGQGVIGLLTRTHYDYSDGTRTTRPPDGSYDGEIAELRGALIEGIIEESEDETLMERYLGGEEIDEAVLIADLEKAVARASFFPVIPVCSGSGVGTLELLEIATRGFPSPPEHRLPEVFSAGGAARKPMACDPGGPLLAEVVKTTSDPYVGRVSLVRVFSGTIRPDATVHVSGHFSAFNDAVAADGSHGHADHDEDERIGTLSFPLGKQQRPAPAVVAGDICAIGRLSRAETGDTLSDKVDPLVLRPWTMPDPLLPVAVQPRAKTDEDKLSVGLQRLAAEDPTLRIEQNPETHQIVLWCMGEAHAGVVLDALSRRYGVSVDTVELRVPLRETLGGKAKGHGRHVKQSGGHGQYAVCDIEVEPLPEGSGFEFVDKVVGGAVPRQFIPSVEKGVRAQMEKGVGSEVGYPVVDIRVTLVDGKAHSVDSSDFAFQMAGGLALREAAAAAGVDLLEPIDEVTVVVPDDLVGAVMSDLAGRRGRVLGTDKADDDRTMVKAEIPEVELTRYAIDLRSLSHGAGAFSRAFARYEPMPDAAAARVRKAV
ncbi:elongation factor G [Mycolicibacterium conceptionense]|jgi:elongation factor G|uniref:Elongation factor G-like protein n=1 Tax=Mycolicibacterium conceptionense TaxID=451644 RepID=A0A0J8U087_9MYCO|nr:MULTISPECIES: elongation factor G-like protein EF-G2 [Mycolicibacterium]KMV15068.1 elongation factor G [Mycolicibacterium conceptionense]MCW1823623.1 elongation factor G-like protein EF-G2 [Mycolicibacterium senegalense]OBB10067.1 elongation factor G [Mycolicibacterium conceptionense]OBF08981.1 elongation factor G [Mycolicibacterium conceptionense]OBH97205.1 elongation factor G [Mycolicibacterium conceptionense]